MKNEKETTPYMSSEDAGPGNVSGRRGRSRRPVKAKKFEDVSETEDEEEVPKSHRTQKRSPRSSNSGKAQPAKRRRWVPHNPLISSPKGEESSKDIQISDDEESGGDGASSSRRRSAACLPSKAGCVPVRDESGRFAGTRPQTEQERRQAALTGGRVGTGGGGGIFKNAAVQVLREECKLMSTGDIAKIAMKRGYVKVQGRTPEATMASAMYTDVKRKSDKSLFIRPHEGLFGLREWLQQGVQYHDPVKLPLSCGVGSQAPSSSQPSRSSRRPTRRSLSTEDNHYQEEFTSQVSSRRRDSMPEPEGEACGNPPAGPPHSRESLPRHRGGQDGNVSDHTPFNNQGDEGPPEQSFLNPQDGLPLPRSGLSNIRKRSTSGPLPAFPSLRGVSNGRRSVRLPSLTMTMSPQNSDNMLMLLNAVDFERSSGLLPKVTQLQEKRQSGAGQQHEGEAKPLISNSPRMQTSTAEPRSQQGPERAPGVGGTNQPAAGPNILSHVSSQTPEEALRQLEASFGTHPLQIANSLLGPLPSAMPPTPALNPEGVKEGSSTVLSAHSSALAPPGPLRLPGSAFQVAAPPQMPRSSNMPNFGPPEENVDRIVEIEAHVHAMENSLGLRHPKVGKGYLYLSRVYQLKATPEFYSKAQEALTHAYEICYAGQVIPSSRGL